MAGRSTDWLSEEWFEQVHEICADGIEGAELSGSAQCEILGGPRGVVFCHWLFEHGRLVSCGPDRADAADVTMTISWDDAVAVQRGEADPNVLFMQGRLKVTGSMGFMATVLSRARTSDGLALLERISAVSRF